MEIVNHKSKDRLLHCAKCNGVLLKDVEKSDMSGVVSFVTKCPHCDCILDVKLSMHGNFMEKVSSLPGS